MNKLVGVGLVGLGVIALSGPYISGTQAESQYHQAIEALNAQAGVEAVSESYEKGYFGADSVTRIKFDRSELDDEMPQEVRFKTHFSHGIYSVKAVSHLALDEETTASLKDILGDKPPVEIVTTVNVFGDASVVATTPNIDFTDPEMGDKISISVFEMTVDVPSDYKQVTASINWPGMKMTGADGKDLAIGQLSMTQTGSQLTDYLWTSDMVLTLDSISGLDSEQRFDLINLKMTSITEEASKGRIDSGFEMSIDSVKLNEEEFKNQKLVFSLKDLAIVEFDTLMGTFDKLEETSQITDPQQQAMAQMEQFARIGQDVTALFNKGLKIDISELFVNTPKGDVTGVLHIEQPESDTAANAGPGALLQTTKGHLSLAVPVQLLALAGPQIQQQLEGLLAQNLIVKDGDVYKTEAKLESMVININGTEMPLPPLM
ncbi:YdgA family protein [Alkalimarinus alittae]|uniref:YdgA family protein n=1 Tax=Alkalimarinus alittae TaxID=2961619 RepID=A0ABY6N0M6_9ALTE|nr:YdgA family protein [Alkalimarinus alittae]UZE95653.1 YdgA family protein [Alkalimarinus alittae]